MVMKIPEDEVFTVCKAIIVAGGFTDFAKEKKVKLVRMNEKNEREIITINAAKVLKEGLIEEDVVVEEEEESHQPHFALCLRQRRPVARPARSDERPITARIVGRNGIFSRKIRPMPMRNIPPVRVPYNLDLDPMSPSPFVPGTTLLARNDRVHKQNGQVVLPENRCGGHAMNAKPDRDYVICTQRPLEVGPCRFWLLPDWKQPSNVN